MDGRVGLLQAKRSLSALVVVSVVMSAFAGFVFLKDSESGSAQAIGDLIVTDGTYTIDGIEQLVDGNVEVNTGGELIIRDGTLSVISNAGLVHYVDVGAGGTLTLDHGVLTTYLDQIAPWPFLDVTVHDGGKIVMTQESYLMFPGNLILMDGAELEMHDSCIDSLDGTLVGQYVIDSAGSITFDSADDGPAISVADSSISMFDSDMPALPEYSSDGRPAGNLTLTGSSTLLAVNSHISVDFGPNLVLGDTYSHNSLVLNDSSTANLYGCWFDEYTGNYADRAPAIVATGETYVSLPTSKGPEDTTGDSYTDLLASGEGLIYGIQPGEVMAINSFDAGPSSAITGATLYIRYAVWPTYDGTEAVTWALEGDPASSTGIVPLASETAYVEKSFDLYAAGVTTTDDIATIDINFEHNGAAGEVFVDSMSIIISIGPEAYIYRWLNLTVGDEYGVPIPDADVSAVYTGSTSFGGQPTFYFVPGDGISPLPPDSVLEYLGVDESTFAVTADDGMVTMPFLTDLVSGGEYPNSLFIGSVEITGSAVIDAATHSSTEAFSFTAYPAMNSGDQSADFTVELVGVVAESPDLARWLVVTSGELVIEDMTYYHAGDVIVAGDGTLIFRDAVFQLVQDFDNQRTVYVDGDATLRFENSVIESDLAIDFIVQGTGTLEVIGSDMTGVDIVAKESATVTLDGSTMDGTLTTSWDSSASIEVYDTELIQAPILSGSSVGHFTNTSVPSIVVEDSAVALIYRWIHVTIFDGAGNPLPLATATARFLINGTYWSSATSDSAGIARVNSLGTIITSSGSTFVGNYKINVTYVYESVPYYASDEVDVGVMPYTEPLGMNATYTSLTVEDALPDLFIDVVGAVTTDPVSPRKGEDTTVTASVQNIGISWAYDVTVDFYDDGVYFGQAVIPLLAPGETIDATAVWSADYPLSPNQHNISVTLDAMDSVLELDDGLAVGYVFVTVMSLPDLQLTSTNIFTDPAAPVVDTPCDLSATVYNLGDTPAYDVVVEFYNGSISPATLINTTTIGQILVGGYGVASVVWTPESVMQHTVFVVVNYPAEFEETSYTNNNASASITVYDHPDLLIQEMSFSTGDHVGGGMPVEVLAQIVNMEPATVVDPVVYMYVDSMDSDPYATTIVYGTVTSSTPALIVSIIYDAPIVDDDTDVEIFLVVNPDHDPVEQDYANNVISSTITITDMRPDVALSTGDVYILKGATDVVNGTFGDQVTIYVELYNLGPTDTGDITVEVGISGEGVNYTISLSLTNVSGATVVSGHQTVMVSWTINITDGGQYAIWAMADVYGNCSEQSEANNYASAEFEILNLAIDILVSVSDSDLKAGDSVAVTVQITQQGTGANVVGLPGVNITLRNEDGAVVAGLADTLTTNEMGVVTVTINVPTGLESGEYVVRVSVLGYDQDSAPITIGGVTARGIPFLVWILVIGVIVAVVAGFTIYTYVYGLGKMVECGECGAFIPAASKRCPKCGVEFEVGTMKCSECGAWVPAESTECPNCGVKFVGEELGEEDYLEKKKKEYDEMVSKYRELAKSELGKKFSDKKFEEWWKGQPTYITFDDWLAKEEEKAKEGPVPCPVCGSLNPKEATVCHKCGTVFTGDTEAPPKSPPQIPPVQPSLVTEGTPSEVAPSDAPQAAPGTAPRMVIRRPIDRKVVPKKIIKTPTNGEGGEQNEGGQ